MASRSDGATVSAASIVAKTMAGKVIFAYYTIFARPP